METIRERELTEEAIELLPQLVRCFKASLSLPPEVEAIPFGQVRILGHLYHHGRSTLSEVAAGVGVSLATASELVDRLVEHGWVARGVNPADRRQIHLWLTDRAIDVSDRLHDARRAQVGAAFARLSAEDKVGFVRGLRALIEAMSAPAGPAGATERERFGGAAG